MLEMFKLKFEYIQNDDLDTISYVNKMINFINFSDIDQIIFSTERKNINKDLIKKLINIYYGKLQYREDSLLVNISCISHSKKSIIENVAHMCLINNSIGYLIYKKMDQMD